MRAPLWAVPLVAALVLAGGASARAADETRQYRVGPAHDNAVPDSPLRPPLRVRWQVAIGLTSSNIVIADGRVFFVNDDRVKAELTALDAASGRVLWSRPAGPRGHGGWGLAYEAGRVFMARRDWSHGDEGHVMAVSAVDGSLQWEVWLPESYGITAAPTVDAGTLYVPVGSGSAYLYALRTSDGGRRWRSPAMLGGSDSSPTLDAGSAYLAYGGGQVYAIDRATGQFRWHYEGCCSGGGGATAVLHRGLLFESSDGNLVHDAATGRVLGSFPAYSGSGSLPAFAGDLGLFHSFNRLIAVAPDGSQRWAYAPLDPYDGLYSTLVAGPYAYVREGEEFVTGIDLATGRPAFCAAFIPPPGSGSYPDTVVGVPHAGAGMLVVPVGYGLVALENGGSTSGCPSASGGPGSQPADGAAGGAGGAGAGSTPALTLSVRRADVRVGARVELTGALRGGAAAGRTVRIQADAFPFDRPRTVASVRTDAGGAFRAEIVVRRNTRVRAVLEGTALASGEVAVYADLPARITRLGAGGPRPRVRVTVTAPRGTAIRSRRVAFYLAGDRAKAWRRVDVARWRALPGKRIRATGAYPAGRLGRRDRVLACTREPRSDGYGRPSPLDRSCGRRRLPRAAPAAAVVRARE